MRVVGFLRCAQPGFAFFTMAPVMLDSYRRRVYRDPTLWREIARANNISDPRTLKPGTELLVPRMR